ncbi:uncharacterized protein TM35_000252420 [Trypanosoma theileri]|uniref:Uncharacterized protein n=1 Tax=Trypanosoma theileri TaxID=67003 RepID=A0A1X0NQE3_9TRYP|nr:uncharacterized protein TM35_000252420 [Trypanosoma theileri]ORC86946.1 hypothetical protein TM35_000252420 [Trypanosoma theileri]
MESHYPVHYTSISSSLNNCPISSSSLLFHTPLGCPMCFLFCCRLIAIPQLPILPFTAVYTPIRMNTTQPHHFHSKPETMPQTEDPIASITSMETQSIRSYIINTRTYILCLKGIKQKQQTTKKNTYSVQTNEQNKGQRNAQ